MFILLYLIFSLINCSASALTDAISLASHGLLWHCQKNKPVDAYSETYIIGEK